MARFNTKTAGTTGGRKTVNKAGGVAFTMTPELELYSLCVTDNLQNKFYARGDETITRLRKLITQVDPRFVVQLAIYTREQMYMRSIPLVMLVELARVHSGDNLVARGLARVIQRADEITETLAYFAQANGRSGTKKLGKMPHGILNGLKAAFNKFDEYQFSKYNRKGEYTLRDALFLVHPRPKNEEQQSIFDRIASDTLATADTWETKVSAAGQTGETAEEKTAAKSEAWAEMIDSGKMGYMALLRNLRNILGAKVGKARINTVAKRIADRKEVLRSKQFPFRFWSAYNELQGMASTDASLILNALEEAMVHAAANISGYDEETDVFIATDFSGSMTCPISDRSKIMYNQVGVALAMLLHSRCKRVINGVFGESYRTINLPTTGGILQNIAKLSGSNHGVGYSTNGWKAIQYLIDNNIKVDKVMVFTDCQLWNSGGRGASRPVSKVWSDYRAKVNPDAKIYLFDMAGYGTTPIDLQSGQNAALLSGWSDKIFDILDRLDSGEDALAEVREIDI